MGKAVALLFMVMIGVATTMSTPVMASGSPNYPPAAKTPSVPSKGSSPAGGRPGGAGSSSCPLDALKLGACVDLLGSLVHMGIGDPVVNQCCPVIQGVLELDAALCFCTTIRLKLLNLNVILPLALELFVQCGVTPPSGFTCPPLN